MTASPRPLHLNLAAALAQLGGEVVGPLVLTGSHRELSQEREGVAALVAYLPAWDRTLPLLLLNETPRRWASDFSFPNRELPASASIRTITADLELLSNSGRRGRVAFDIWRRLLAVPDVSPLEAYYTWIRGGPVRDIAAIDALLTLLEGGAPPAWVQSWSPEAGQD